MGGAKDSAASKRRAAASPNKRPRANWRSAGASLEPSDSQAPAPRSGGGHGLAATPASPGSGASAGSAAANGCVDTKQHAAVKPLAPRDAHAPELSEIRAFVHSLLMQAPRGSMGLKKLYDALPEALHRSVHMHGPDLRSVLAGAPHVFSITYDERAILTISLCGGGGSDGGDGRSARREPMKIERSNGDSAPAGAASASAALREAEQASFCADKAARLERLRRAQQEACAPRTVAGVAQQRHAASGGDDAAELRVLSQSTEEASCVSSVPESHTPPRSPAPEPAGQLGALSPSLQHQLLHAAVDKLSLLGRLSLADLTREVQPSMAVGVGAALAELVATCDSVFVHSAASGCVQLCDPAATVGLLQRQLAHLAGTLAERQARHASEAASLSSQLHFCDQEIRSLQELLRSLSAHGAAVPPAVPVVAAAGAAAGTAAPAGAGFTGRP